MRLKYLYVVTLEFAADFHKKPEHRATSTKNPNYPVRYIGHIDAAGVLRAGEPVIGFSKGELVFSNLNETRFLSLDRIAPGVRLYF